MPQRFAIYHAPATESPLWRAASQWLGRDPSDTDARLVRPAGVDVGALDARTVSARRYGFHATIKAPMMLAQGETGETLNEALAAFAAANAPVAIGRLKLALIDGFVALIPARQSDALTGFAGRVVTEFDRFRAPPSAEERARRLRNTSLTPRQLELIDSLGYPYVLEQFQLHMTLTDRLAGPERDVWREQAARHFGELAEGEASLDRLVLFTEAEAGAPFVRGAEFVLQGKGPGYD